MIKKKLTNKPETWWERNARMVWAGIPSIDRGKLTRLIWFITHDDGLNRRPFWVHPDGTVEEVERHLDTPDEKDRGMTPTKAGYIRGRIAEIPCDYTALIHKVDPRREEKGWDEFMDRYMGGQVINLYADAVEDFTNPGQVLSLFSENAHKLSVPVKDNALVYVSVGKVSGEFIGTFGDVAKVKYVSPLSKYKAAKKKGETVAELVRCAGGWSYPRGKRRNNSGNRR